MKHLIPTPRALLAALLALLMISPFRLAAQSSAFVESMPSVIVNKNGVVRSASPTEFVSSHNYSTNSTLFTKVGMASAPCELLLTGVTVLDFQIENGYVIFCGQFNSVAAIGSFPLSAFSIGATAHVNITFSRTLGEFGRMGVYSMGSPSKVHIVMLEDSPSISYPYLYRFLAECDYDLTTGSCGNINRDYAFNNGGVAMHASDIVVTDTNVIILGSDGLSGILMRRCPKSSVFASPQADVVYSYSLPNEPEQQNIVGVNMCKGLFATANPSYRNATAWRMHVRVFDIASMKMLHDQYIDLEEKTNPRSILYLKEVDSLVVLQHHAYVAAYGTESDLVAFKPFAPANYLVTAIWPADPKTLSSQCLMDGHSVVAVAGQSAFWFYNNYANTAPSACRQSQDLNCIIEPTVEYVTRLEPFSPTSYFSRSYLDSTTVNSLTLTTICN